MALAARRGLIDPPSMAAKGLTAALRGVSSVMLAALRAL